MQLLLFKNNLLTPTNHALLLATFSQTIQPKKLLSTRTQNATSLLNNYFEIYFLKKEKAYTKLKYSRVPQYDIVSGGSAALFAGFLGFLICEKFGFELIDSGDFYIALMYIVFSSFFLRLVLYIHNFEQVFTSFFFFQNRFKNITIHYF